MQEQAKEVTVWHHETFEKRKAVGCEDLKIRPWTGREDVVLRGCMQQSQGYNFLWETLDTRWMYACYVRGDQFWVPPRDSDCTDITQSVKHQLAKGKFVLLTKSIIYWHAGDRTFAPEEHLTHNGYEPNKHILEGISESVPQLKVIKEGGDPSSLQPKKKRAKAKPKVMPKPRVKHAVKLRNLGGNGMIVPDLMSLAVSSLYAVEGTDLFENDVEDSDGDEVHIQGDQAAAATFYSIPTTADGVVQIDPGLAASLAHAEEAEKDDGGDTSNSE